VKTNLSFAFFAVFAIGDILGGASLVPVEHPDIMRLLNADS
jgi:hypothetical protein